MFPFLHVEDPPDTAPVVSVHSPSARLASTKKTFDNQGELPRLPVPSLSNLAVKYLNSCRPVLKRSEYASTETIVQEFTRPEGFGQVLQDRLIEWDKSQPNSWLESMWLEKAYLEWREPSLINVNWWAGFIDHPKHPSDLLAKPPPKGVLTAFQIQRASGLITSMLNFKELIDTLVSLTQGRIPT